MREYLILYKTETLLKAIFNARSINAFTFSDAENKFKAWVKENKIGIVHINQITLIS